MDKKSAVRQGKTHYGTKLCDWWIEKTDNEHRLIVESDSTERWFVAIKGSLDFCFGYLIGKYGVVTHINGARIHKDVM